MDKLIILNHKMTLNYNELDNIVENDNLPSYFSENDFGIYSTFKVNLVSYAEPKLSILLSKDLTG